MPSGTASTWEQLMSQEKRVISEQEFEEVFNRITSSDYHQMMENSEFRQTIRDNAITYGEALGLDVRDLLDLLDDAKSADVIDKVVSADPTIMDAYLNTLWGNKVLKGGSGVASGIKSIKKGSISTSRNSGVFGNLASSLSVFSSREVIEGFKTKIESGSIRTEDYIDFVSCMADSILSGAGIAKDLKGIDTTKVSTFSEMFGYKPVADLGSDSKAVAWNKTGSFKSIPKSTIALSGLGVATNMGFLSANVSKYIRIKDNPDIPQREKDACIISMTADCVGIVGDVIGMIPNPVTQIISAAISGINGILKAASYATSKDVDTGKKILAFACALVPTLNFDSIEKAVALKNLMDKTEIHEDYLVYESMYQASIFESIPIINMFSFIFTEAAKGQLREKLKKEYGSIDGYYEARFENRNTQQFFESFKNILVENPKIDLLQTFNGYVYGDIDSTIRAWINDGQRYNVFFSKYSLDKNLNVVNEVKNYFNFTTLDVNYNVDLSVGSSGSDRYTMSNINYNQNFNREINHINSIVQKARVNGFEAAFNQYSPLDVYSYTGIKTQKEKVLAELETLTRITEKWSYHVFYNRHWIIRGNNKTILPGDFVSGLDDFRQRYFNHLVGILASKTVLSDYSINDNNNTNNILNIGLLNFVDRTLINMGGGDDFLSLTQSHNRDQRYFVVADGGVGKDKVDLSKLMYLNGNLQKINSVTNYTLRYNINLLLSQMDVTVNYGNTTHRHSWFAGKNSDVNELFRFKNFEIHELANGTINNVTVESDNQSASDGQFVIVGGDLSDNVDFRKSTKTSLVYKVEDGADDGSSKGTYNSTIHGSKIKDYIDMKYKNHTNDQGSKNNYYGYEGDDIFVVKGDAPSGVNKRYADGGTGFDTLDLSELSGGTNLYLSDNGGYRVEYHNNQGTKTGEDRGINIEFYKGTNHNDNITGSSGDDNIDSMNGRDVINSGAGEDNIILRNGSYTVNSGSENDRIYISEVSDNISAVVDGGEQEDTLDFSTYSGPIRSNYNKYYPSNKHMYYTRNGSINLLNVENIIGTEFGDTINGNDMANKLYGQAGNDTIRGYDGNDILSGGEGTNNLYGGAGDDTLVVGDGTDNAYGEGDDDKFYVKNNIDAILNLDGGDGNDVAIYNEVEYSLIADLSSNGAISKISNSNYDFTSIDLGETETRSDNLDLSDIRTSANPVKSDSITSIESVFGGKGNDLILGTNQANVLNGGDGNDKIYGFGGNDEIGDGLGDDVVYAGSGDDKISISDGNDIIFAGSGTDYIFMDDNSQFSNQVDGGQGDDTAVYKDSTDGRLILMTDDQTVEVISSKYGIDLINKGKDTLKNTENVVGSSYDDKIIGNSSANQIHGYDGNDLIYGGDGNDELLGGAGNNELHGEGGNDRFVLEGANDIAYGGQGDDTFYRKGSSSDNKRIDGGIGKDELIYLYSESGIKVDLDQMDDQGYSTVSLVNSEGIISSVSDKVKNIEVLMGSNYSDEIFGTNNDDEIIGYNGDDEIRGRGGNDTIATGAGNDTVYGDDGNDTIIIGEGRNTVYGGNNDDTFEIVGSVVDINTINGDDGRDTLKYIEADYKVVVSLETNRINKYSKDGGLDAPKGYDIVQNVEVLSLTNYDDIASGSSNADTIIGLGGDDKIEGNAGDDVLVGATGNDTVNGGLGNDTIVLGQGNDTVSGDSGSDTFLYDSNIELSSNTVDGGDNHDTIDYTNLNGNVNISVIDNKYRVDKLSSDGSVNYGTDILTRVETIIGSKHRDSFQGGINADIFHGNDGDDIIYGNDGNDMIYGDAGRDTLYGGNGNDELYIDNIDIAYGGDGEDTFFVQNLSISGIGEFEGGAGVDKIEYSESNTGIRGSLRESMFFRQLRSDSGGVLYNSTEIVSGIENVVGSNFDDTFGGDNNVNILDGLYGDDEINGYGGNDLIYGGYGNDYLHGDEGDDTLLGGANDDVLNGGVGDDILKGQEGNNVYEFDQFYGFGNDTIDNYYEGSAFLDNKDYNKINLKYVYNPGDLFFKKDGNDLNISVRDKGEIKVNNWFLHDSFKVDAIYLANGENYIITSDKVKVIMDAIDIYTKYRKMSYEELYNMLDGGLYEMVRQLSTETINSLDELGSKFRFVKEYKDLVENGVATVSGIYGNKVIENVSDLNPYDNTPITTISFSYLTPYKYRLGFEYLKFEKNNGNLSIIDHNNNSYTINNWDSLNGSVSLGFSTQNLTAGEINYIISSMEKYTEVTGLSWNQAIEQSDYKYDHFMQYMLYNDVTDFSTLDYEFDFTNEYNQRHGIALDSSNLFSGVTDGTVDFSDKNRNLWADLGTGDVFIGKSFGASSYYIQDSDRDIFTANKKYSESISNFIGSSRGDYITGSNNDNVIYGQDGSDYISGLLGNDTIYGGNGEDRLFGGVGNDTLFGGAERDQLFGEDGNDTIYGGAGNDFISGQAGNDYLNGGSGADEYCFYNSYDNNGIEIGFGNDIVEDTGEDRDKLYFAGIGLSRLSFNMNGSDLLINLTDSDSSVTIKDFNQAKPYDISLSGKNNDLGALIAQISAYESTWNLSWDEMMQKTRSQAYSENLYQQRLAAEDIVGYNY